MPSTGSDGKPGRTARRWVGEIGPFLTMGIQLALSVVVFFFIGRWLDEWWGTAPWLMLAGLFLGAAGGFLQFFRSVAAIGKEEKSREKSAKEER